MVAELRVHTIDKRLGGRDVLCGVDLRCSGGEITVLTGANGAGKSTLLAIIAGVIEPDAGDVAIARHADDGEQVWRGRQARRRLGYVPEAADPPGHLTGAELLRLVCALRDAPMLPASTLDRLGLPAIARRRVDRMSLGERRRLCLGAALIGEPLALVLDEPSNGLDTGGVAVLVELLEAERERGVATLVATHDAELAEAVGDRHLHLADGAVADRV